jgi:hypothetical protein
VGAHAALGRFWIFPVNEVFGVVICGDSSGIGL